MSRFNHYFNNHFAGCRLLAYARDTSRERDVRIYLVPGEAEAVGITDGTDCWIAPVIRGAQYFKRVDVWQMLDDLRNGKELPKPVPLDQLPAGRRKIILHDAASSEPVIERRRIAVNIPAPADAIPRRGRRVLPASF